MIDDAQHINLSDEELLRLHRRAKDNKWLGVLLQRYTTLLLGVAIKYMKDKEQAADCVQHVFLKALTSLPDEDIQNFKGWLYILMRNHCFQLLRDKKYVSSEEAFYDRPAPERPNEEQLYKHEYTIDQMNAAITELEEGQQVCIKMFYLEKKTYQQIMDARGYTFKQVKSYVQNGKRKLKLILEERLKNTPYK